MQSTKAIHWLRVYRSHACIGLLVIAGMLWLKLSETKPAPEHQVRQRQVVVQYVGPLTTVVSRSGRMQGSTQLDGGYGIGIANDVDRDPLMLKLRPTVYLPFDPILGIGREQAEALATLGPSLTIGLLQEGIVTLDSPAGPVLAYGTYAQKIEARRRWLMGAALLAAACAVLLYVFTRPAPSAGEARLPD